MLVFWRNTECVIMRACKCSIKHEDLHAWSLRKGTRILSKNDITLDQDVLLLALCITMIIFINCKGSRMKKKYYEKRQRT